MEIRKASPQYFADTRLLPEGFKYPESYIEFVRSSPPFVIGPTNEDWCVIDSSQIEAYFKEVKMATPDRVLVPFMRRNGDDGVACFDWTIPADDPKIFYCNVFNNKGCWPDSISFTEFLASIPPIDSEDE